MQIAGQYGPLKDRIRQSQIVIVALAPGAAACHIAFQAFLRALHGPVQNVKRPDLVQVQTIITVADHTGRFILHRKRDKADTGIKSAVAIDRQHFSRAAPVSIIPGIQRLPDHF